MLKTLIDAGGKRNTDLADSIQKKLSHLVDEYIHTSEEESNHKSLGTTIEIVGKILQFNKKYHNQQGRELKILTPQ